MLWFYALTVAAVALSFWFYRERLGSRPQAGERERTFTEASAEIGAPPEAVDDGSLRGKELRKDNLSKEVELDWEASDLIETQPGADARYRDPRERDYVLPERYGMDRLVLMARDPRWLYAYWEMASDRYQELRSRRLDEWGLSRPVLRLYDLSEESPVHRVVDVELQDDAENWYVRLNRPRHRFVAEIGRIFPDGFVPLLRSNEVQLPPDLPSMEISEEWAPVDWEGKYGRYAGAVGVSSPGVWGR